MQSIRLYKRYSLHFSKKEELEIPANKVLAFLSKSQKTLSAEGFSDIQVSMEEYIEHEDYDDERTIINQRMFVTGSRIETKEETKARYQKNRTEHRVDLFKKLSTLKEQIESGINITPLEKKRQEFINQKNRFNKEIEDGIRKPEDVIAIDKFLQRSESQIEEVLLAKPQINQLLKLTPPKLLRTVTKKPDQLNAINGYYRCLWHRIQQQPGMKVFLK